MTTSHNHFRFNTTSQTAVFFPHPDLSLHLHCLNQGCHPPPSCWSEPQVHPRFPTQPQSSHSPSASPVISAFTIYISDPPTILPFHCYHHFSLVKASSLASQRLFLFLPDPFPNNDWNGLFRIKSDHTKMLINAVKCLFQDWISLNTYLYICEYTNISIVMNRHLETPSQSLHFTVAKTNVRRIILLKVGLCVCEDGRNNAGQA